MTNKPMLSVELLPCPFCGGKDLRQYSYNPGMDVYYRVQCYCLGSAQGRTPEEAVEEWNKRYPRGQGDPVAIVTGSTVQWLPGAGKLKDRTPLYAEQPEPAADYTQCEECKGWGYHENHHEGGGTECGECGGSGNATVAEVMVMPDRMKVEPFTTIDRGSKNYKAGYNAAISEVAKLNGLKT